jgi:hypothetical protein
VPERRFTHPTMAALLLMVAVLVAVIVLAAISTFVGS